MLWGSWAPQILNLGQDTRAGKDQGRTQQTRTTRGATSIGSSVTHRPEGEAVKVAHSRGEALPAARHRHHLRLLSVRGEDPRAVLNLHLCVRRGPVGPRCRMKLLYLSLCVNVLTSGRLKFFPCLLRLHIYYG